MYKAIDRAVHSSSSSSMYVCMLVVCVCAFMPACPLSPSLPHYIDIVPTYTYVCTYIRTRPPTASRCYVQYVGFLLEHDWQGQSVSQQNSHTVSQSAVTDSEPWAYASSKQSWHFTRQQQRALHAASTCCPSHNAHFHTLQPACTYTSSSVPGLHAYSHIILFHFH